MTSLSRQHQLEAWYLAQLRPNCLSMGRRNLERQGFEVFCPMLMETRRSRGRFRQVMKALFPGYLFVKFNPIISGWQSINGTRGVSRLVGFGGVPKPVPPALVGSLRFRCDGDGLLLPPIDLQPGDSVRVTEGPFADFVGTIEKTVDNERVWVLLDIMGREARAVLPNDIMQRANEYPDI